LRFRAHGHFGSPHWQLADIESLAAECAFRDCRHAAEPACAVRAALKRSTLAAQRLESYRKLERELQYVAAKQGESLRIARSNRWKAIAKQHRQRERARTKYPASPSGQ
jgi:ribosome biogenesis GTPase